MSNEVWAIILGLIVTGIATFLKNKDWFRGVKILLVLGLAVVLGVIQTIVSLVVAGNQITALILLENVGIILATSQTVYNLIWEKIEPKLAPSSHTT